MLGPGRSIYRRSRSITINKPSASKFSRMVIYYDRYRKINEFNGRMYDSRGNLIKKLKKSDIIDVKSSDGSTLYDDNRVMSYEFHNNNYPYTIEFEFEIEQKSTYIIPSWFPYPDWNVSVKESTYMIITPRGYKINYRLLNDLANPEIIEDNNIIMHWSIKDLPFLENEDFSPTLSEVSPGVIAAHKEFKIHGNIGDMISWQSFGKLFNNLNEGRDIIPTKTKDQLKQLTSDASIKQKIDMVYKYVQNNTRYVSIQLGIGGLQPFPAEVVDDLGYGDCKALTNYTCSLLKAVGIPSHYTLVYGGSNPPEIYPDFPYDAFNHVILCVPVNSDTIWLECTDQRSPTNFLGSFTDDRYALLIAESGGKLVKTPFYGQEDNLQIRNATVNINNDGNATMSCKTVYSNLQSEKMLPILYADNEDREDRLYKRIRIPNFSIISSELIGNEENPAIEENLELALPSYTAKVGSRLMFKPNLMNKWDFSLDTDEERKYDVITTYAYTDIDSIHFTLPSGYALESIPKDTIITSTFGYYENRYIKDDNSILYTRIIKTNKTRKPKEHYPNLVKFLNGISRNDNMSIILKKR
ncbi:DUF3857 domain-containing protein [Bacteroidota bacterium]